MSDLPRVVRADSDDVDSVARLIGEAWCDLDQAAWLVPNRRQRRTILGEVARIQIEHALFYGAVDVLSDGTAAAVWFDRYRPLPPPPDYEMRLADVTGSNYHRFIMLEKLLDGHRSHAGHEHLAYLAVASGFRGGSRGRLLVRHHLAQLDRAEVATYADAPTDAARDFYRHFGYRPIRTVSVPNGSRICLMWRAVPLIEVSPDQ